MNKPETVPVRTFPIWTLLCAVLIILKLLGKITIGWAWVFSPLWIPLGLIILGLLGAGALAASIFAFKELRRK